MKRQHSQLLINYTNALIFTFTFSTVRRDHETGVTDTLVASTVVHTPSVGAQSQLFTALIDVFATLVGGSCPVSFVTLAFEGSSCVPANSVCAHAVSCTLVNIWKKIVAVKIEQLEKFQFQYFFLKKLKHQTVSIVYSKSTRKRTYQHKKSCSQECQRILSRSDKHKIHQCSCKYREHHRFRSVDRWGVCTRLCLFKVFFW